ncbi:kinesin [Angomonas deanei]|nr:kinesin [Angomonas deanei]|eukprot:EPY22103.1 kinesin [Angomonas deanei]
MLATVAPSAYCYLQTLNTLRFAGVAKKVINVATVNEDQHFQKLIADLRQQIIRLTLQIEGGKASEAHREEVRTLKEEKEELLAENDRLKLQVVKVVDNEMVTALRKRVEELEANNEMLQKEKFSLQQRLLSSTTQLREELAAKRADILKLQDGISLKDTAIAEWTMKYKALDQQLQLRTAALAAAESKGGTSGGDGGTSASTPPPVIAGAKDETSTLRKKIAKLTAEITQSNRTHQETVDQLKTTRDQLDDYKTRYEENKMQLNRLHERMENTLGLLETTQCQLAAVKTESGAETAKASALQESLLNAQLDQIRDDYLAEKQSNVQLLLRVSNLEQERSQLKNDLSQRQEDVFELEQMLMEETENSERYYLRLRHQRTLCDIQQHLTRRVAGSAMGETRQGDYARNTSYSYSAQPSPTSAFASPRTDVLNASLSMMSHAPFDPLAQSTSHQNSWELMYAQLEYECLCDEAQSRSLIEQEYMVSTMRLLARKTKLKAAELQQLQERHTELAEKVHMLEEEAEYYKKKSKDTDTRLADAQEQLAMAQAEAEERGVEQLRLTRKVRTLEESNDELERARNTLVERVAELEDANDTLKQRCVEAEQLATETQNYFCSSPTQKEGSSDDQNSSGGARPSSMIRAAIEQTTLTMKERELQTAKEEIARLTQQCESYRAEIGALRAEADKGNQTVLDNRDQLRREVEQYQKQKQALEHSKAQLSQLMDSTVADYEKRVVQQQDMINTLRRALDEETSMADACRASAQRAEADRLAAEEEVLLLKENSDELRRATRESESKILKLQKELDDLRAQYNVFERQLMELKVREPELFLVIERSAGEDGSVWLDKARREKANMEKQKLEARRMNVELLEHVRRRNSHLREVQQQIQDVSLTMSPGVTPINDSLYDASALEEYNMLVSARNTVSGQSPPILTGKAQANFGDDLSLPSSLQGSDINTPTAVEHKKK